MSKMIFTNKFSESLAALLMAYDNAPIYLSDELMKGYLNNFIENGPYIYEHVHNDYTLLGDPAFWKDIFSEESLFGNNPQTSKSVEYLLSIFMVLYAIHDTLQKPHFYKLKLSYSLWCDTSRANTFISSLVMDFDFRDRKGLDFSSKYMPNNMVVKYIFNIHKTEINKWQITEDLGLDIDPQEDLSELMHKFDYDIIMAGTAFMQVQAVLLLLNCSDLYSKSTQEIAKTLIMSFKELLADVRIEKMEIDTAIASGIMREGVKTTTGIKIFFALENFDRYCLRIDFPHDGEEFLHYNLHEPGRKNALPLNTAQYNSLAGKYKHLDELFFHFNNLYWFRSNFISKLERMAPEKDSSEYENYLYLRKELLDLFHKQGHYRMFGNDKNDGTGDDMKNDISESDMRVFVAEFGTALSQMPEAAVLYSDTGIDNISSELNRIKLKDVLYYYLTLYQGCTYKELLLGKSCRREKEEIKTRVLDILFGSYKEAVTQYGEYKDFAELNLKEILELVWEICCAK